MVETTLRIQEAYVLKKKEIKIAIISFFIGWIAGMITMGMM